MKLSIYNKDNSLEKEIECNSEKTLLDQMLVNNSSIHTGCFGGSCGACKCEIIEGEKFIDREAIKLAVYKDLKNNQVLPCIAKLKENVKDGEVKLKKCV